MAVKGFAPQGGFSQQATRREKIFRKPSEIGWKSGIPKGGGGDFGDPLRPEYLPAPLVITFGNED
jgi:hypothetical protein